MPRVPRLCRFVSFKCERNMDFDLNPSPNNMTIACPECIWECFCDQDDWEQVGSDGSDIPIIPPTDNIDVVIGMETSGIVGKIVEPHYETRNAREETTLVFAKDNVWRGAFLGSF